MKFFEVRMFPGLKLTLGFTYTEVTFFVLNPSEQFYRKQLIGSLARADCGVGQGDPGFRFCPEISFFCKRVSDGTSSFAGRLCSRRNRFGPC